MHCKELKGLSGDHNSSDPEYLQFSGLHKSYLALWFDYIFELT